MEGMKLWGIVIKYNGGNTFEYTSDCDQRDLAVAAATRKLFEKNIAISPQDTRINEVYVQRLSRSEVDGKEKGTV